MRHTNAVMYIQPRLIISYAGREDNIDNQCVTRRLSEATGELSWHLLFMLLT